MKFLVDSTMPKLVINMTSAGTLVPMTDFPTTGKFKSTYFLRLEDVPLTEQNMRQTLLIGDLTPKPLDEMQVFLENVSLSSYLDVFNLAIEDSNVDSSRILDLHFLMLTILEGVFSQYEYIIKRL